MEMMRCCPNKIDISARLKNRWSISRLAYEILSYSNLRGEASRKCFRNILSALLYFSWFELSPEEQTFTSIIKLMDTVDIESKPPSKSVMDILIEEACENERNPKEEVEIMERHYKEYMANSNVYLEKSIRYELRRLRKILSDEPETDDKIN